MQRETCLTLERSDLVDWIVDNRGHLRAALQDVEGANGLHTGKELLLLVVTILKKRTNDLKDDRSLRIICLQFELTLFV